MNNSTYASRKRVVARVAVVAAVPCAVVSVLGGAAFAGDGDDPPDDQVVEEASGGARIEQVPEVPIWVQARERERLCELAAQVPANWPAAQVNRRAAEQPLGDAAQREEWLRDATLMPSYWPAAQVLLADAEQRWDCSWVD